MSARKMRDSPKGDKVYRLQPAIDRHINFRPNQASLELKTRFKSDVFHDVAVLGQMFGWEMDFRQLDSGDASIPASVVMGEHLLLTHMHLPRRYHQLGRPPSSQLSFGIPISPMTDWFGRPYVEGSILPFDLADGFDGTSDRDFEAMTFSVSRSLLRDLSRDCQIPLTGDLLMAQPGAFLTDSPAVRQLRGLLATVMKSQGRGVGKDVEETLAIALLEAASSTKRQNDHGSPRQRSRALSNALALLEAQRGEALTVAAVCRATGASLRTLNRAFRERFGIGPKAYLTRQRLSDLRNELLHAPPDTRITDLAYAHGFWHLGQLARSYRATFGELPSETLHSARAAASRAWA